MTRERNLAIYRSLRAKAALFAIFAFAAAFAAAETDGSGASGMSGISGISGENASSSWLGSAELVASVPFEETDHVGLEAETRLIFDSRPEAGVGFRAEGGLRWTWGGASQEALAFDSSLANRPDPSELPPGADLHRVVFLDQAFAEVALGIADLSFGIVPIAWGTGYVFNPTSRTAPAEFPDDVTGTAPGALGSSVRLALPAGFSMEAYAVAEPRLRSAVPASDELAGERFPFGAKLQFRSELVDTSVSFLRELTTAGAEAAYWTGADAAGFVGPVSWYAEAALRLPGGGGSDKSDWKALDESEACLGISWTVPIIDATVRSEAAWFGTGHGDVAEYDVASLLEGRRALLARRYLFAQLEKEDPDAAKWKLSGGALVNLDDRSSVLIGEGMYSPYLSVEFRAFVYLFLSDDDGELGGSRAIGPGIEFTPYRSAYGLGAKLSF